MDNACTYIYVFWWKRYTWPSKLCTDFVFQQSRSRLIILSNTCVFGHLYGMLFVMTKEKSINISRTNVLSLWNWNDNSFWIYLVIPWLSSNIPNNLYLLWIFAFWLFHYLFLSISLERSFDFHMFGCFYRNYINPNPYRWQ